MYLNKDVKEGIFKNTENLKKTPDLLKDKLHFFFLTELITFSNHLKNKKDFNTECLWSIGRETPSLIGLP